MAQCAVENYCERWFAPEHRKALITPNTDFWSEHDVRIVITGDGLKSREVGITLGCVGRWKYSQSLVSFLLSGLEGNAFQAILRM